MEYRRAQIREHLGFRVCSAQDAEKLTVWLAANVAHTHRPMIDALALVQRYAVAGNSTYFPLGEVAPEHRGTGGRWAELVCRADKRGRRRFVRMVYEVAAF